MNITHEQSARVMTAEDRRSSPQFVESSSVNLLYDYKTQTDLVGTLVAYVGFGVILTTSSGQIIYANDAAETLIRLRRGLSSQHGRIVATDVKTNDKLRALISAASIRIGEKLSGGSMILSDQDGEEPFAVHVVPVSQKTSSQLVSQERLIAGIFIADRNRELTARLNIFAPMFGLTPGETRVLAALISGNVLTKAARKLKIAESTARQHLTHIMAKTDTHRQAELMRLFFEMTIPSEGWRRLSLTAG
jgi:DNA-binding CsgD family transcriptional regulator